MNKTLALTKFSWRSFVARRRIVTGIWRHFCRSRICTAIVIIVIVIIVIVIRWKRYFHNFVSVVS